MLPTENKTNIFIDNKLFTTIGILEPQTGKSINSIVEGQHLYITSDDEIKEGDWVYKKDVKGFIYKHKATKNLWYSDERKIIATTDKSLKTREYTEEEQDRAHFTSLPTLTLPQPSKAFIEKYCKVGGIDEVIVEFIEWCENCGESNCDKLQCKQHEDILTLKTNSHNQVTIHPIKYNWTKEEIEKINRKLLR